LSIAKKKTAKNAAFFQNFVLVGLGYSTKSKCCAIYVAKTFYICLQVFYY